MKTSTRFTLLCLGCCVAVFYAPSEVEKTGFLVIASVFYTGSALLIKLEELKGLKC